MKRRRPRDTLDFAAAGCGALRPYLELHAEGELRPGPLLTVVLRHLADCDDCQAYAEAHEDLTADLLAGESRAGSPERVERIMGRVRALPPRFSSAFVAATMESSRQLPRRASPCKRRESGASRFLWRAAAVLAFGTALTILWALRGSEAPRLAGVVPAGGAIGPLSTAEASQGPARKPDEDLRWVISTSALPLMDPARPVMRLHGYRGSVPAATPAQKPSRPEWVVNAAPGPWRSRDARFFLLSLTGDAEPVEISPLEWRAATTAADQAVGELDRDQPAYRVYILRGASTLSAPARVEVEAPTLDVPFAPSGRESGWRRDPWTVLTRY